MTYGSFIAEAILSKSQDTVKFDQLLTLSLSFKVDGAIRQAFDQKNWERAYNKHDNGFRMTFEVDVKSGRRTILPIKFVGKLHCFGHVIQKFLIEFGSRLSRTRLHITRLPSKKPSHYCLT